MWLRLWLFILAAALQHNITDKPLYLTNSQTAKLLIAHGQVSYHIRMNAVCYRITFKYVNMIVNSTAGLSLELMSHLGGVVIE